MNILFVYRGYGKSGLNSVIDFQRDSLTKTDVNIENFLIKSGGIKNYIKAIFELKRYLRKNTVDVIHAHYSFSGYIAGLATRKPVVCSLMGSDVLKSHKLLGVLTKFFNKFIWNKTIVKSVEMQKRFPKALLIPNGVNFENFRPIAKEEALKRTGFNSSAQNIIFVAEGTDAKVKNLQLGRKAIELLNDPNVVLHLISGKTFTELPFIYNAADVLLLTSLSEGSPNVIKEAMACNCPIVATDVGDISQVIGNTEGCFVTTFDERDVASKLKLALAFNKRTNGRDHIQRFDSRLIAEKIVTTYRNLMNRE